MVKWISRHGPNVKSRVRFLPGLLMSFDKYYPKRKDWRNPYMGKTSKKVDRTCRNHGSCPYCAAGRQHCHKRQQPLVEGPHGEVYFKAE